MSDLVSSACGGMGDAVVDLPGGGVGRDSRPFGELDRDGLSGAMGERRADGAELEFGVTEAENGGCGDSSLSGILVFGTARGAPWEKDGGGLTGAASSGDVMGSQDVLVI
jgi:hypothetical protein